MLEKFLKKKISIIDELQIILYYTNYMDFKHEHCNTKQRCDSNNVFAMKCIFHHTYLVTFNSM